MRIDSESSTSTMTPITFRSSPPSSIAAKILQHAARTMPTVLVSFWPGLWIFEMRMRLSVSGITVESARKFWLPTHGPCRISA